MTKRRLPRPSEILPLIGRPQREVPRAARRLQRCASIGDLREVARRRTPRAVFDYTDGAAMSEASLQRARASFSRVEFQPRVLRDVSDVDTSITALGQHNALPLLLAPTGFTRMMHHSGEPAVARAAGERGIAYALSTLGTTSIEDLAEAAPSTRRWFQLYVTHDRAQGESLMKRAERHGYDTLILTVDVPVGGIRRREIRDGLTIPPQLRLGTLADMSRYPRWWFNVLTTEPLTFATLTTTGGTVGELMTRVFDPRLSWADIAWIRDNWGGRIMLKGIQSSEDAALAADAGVDGIVLSNHGGRQIDQGNVPLELLPEVLARVGGKVEVYLDGGVMSGTDVVAALCFGARGVLVGRAYLYGLMAGGYHGVVRALDILEKEIRTTMQLLGASTVADLNPGLVRLR